MKMRLIKVAILGALIAGAVSQAISGDNNTLMYRSYDQHVRVPNAQEMRWYARYALVAAVNGYLNSVKIALAMQGDPEAIEAFQVVLESYTTQDMICSMGVDNVRDFSEEINRMLPEVPGISLATVQVIMFALRQALSFLGL